MQIYQHDTEYFWKPQLCKERLYVKAQATDLPIPSEEKISLLKRRDRGLSPALSCPQNLAHCSALTKLFDMNEGAQKKKKNVEVNESELRSGGGGWVGGKE